MSRFSNSGALGRRRPAPAGTRRPQPDPSAFVRDSPQTRIRAWCESRGVACLDPLPKLREAERSGRTYHLRDTHWNARGNRVVGELLGDWTASLLAD